MKTSSLSLAIAVLAFGASTIYLAVQLSEERAHSEELADATRALNARIADLENARAAPPAISGSFGALDMAPGLTRSAASPANADAQPEVFEAALVNAPPMPPRSAAFQKMIRSQIRAQNRQTYSDAGSELGLSREDANKLIDLLTEQQVSGIGASRDVADVAERERLMDASLREYKTQIADLLGPEKLKLLEEYQQSIPARQELDMLARQLEGSDAAALSSDQRKRLIAALTEERKRVPVPVPSERGGPDEYAKLYSDWQDDYSARVASQARPILNAEQYAAFDEYQQAQKEMRDQMTHWRIQAGRGNGAIFTTAAPGAAVEATIVTTTRDSDEQPHDR